MVSTIGPLVFWILKCWLGILLFLLKIPFKYMIKSWRERYLSPRHFDAKIKNLITNLLQRDVSQRFGCMKNGIMDIKMDMWYSTINWDAIYNLRIDNQPYTPKVEGEGDTSNFDAYPDDGEDVRVPLEEDDAKNYFGFSMKCKKRVSESKRKKVLKRRGV